MPLPGQPHHTLAHFFPVCAEASPPQSSVLTPPSHCPSSPYPTFLFFMALITLKHCLCVLCLPHRMWLCGCRHSFFLVVSSSLRIGLAWTQYRLSVTNVERMSKWPLRRSYRRATGEMQASSGVTIWSHLEKSSSGRGVESGVLERPLSPGRRKWAEGQLRKQEPVCL